MADGSSGSAQARVDFSHATYFQQLVANLQGGFAERDSVIEGMVCAALAGEHVLLLGPPGTAKSALTRAFCGAVEGAQYFEWLLSKFSAPEELFGPISLSALKADRFERITTGKLPQAHVAFLDEIFKSNSGVLNTLLTALNERKFHNGAGAVDIPLRMVVGASNELPEGPELGALYDRFLVRYMVDRVRTPNAFFSVLTGSEEEAETTLTLKAWDEARAQVAAVAFPQATQQAFWKLRQDLGREGINPSDRRLKRAVKLVKANAWMSGDLEAGEEHMGVLADVLWDAPEQRETVAKVVGAISSGQVGEAAKIRDLVLQTVQNLPAAPASGPTKEYQDALVAANKEGKRAITRLKGMAEALKNSAKAAKIRAMVEQVEEALGPVRESARQALGL